MISRRHFLARLAAVSSVPLWGAELAAQADRASRELRMAYGLVTYLWGQDWDLPTLLENCERAGVLGVELRTTHAHGVEPSLNMAQREEVRRRFADSPVQLVGVGSDERFDNPDPAVVRKAIESAKEFIRLSHDVGGTGVKVKPDRFHPSVARQETISQIGRSLNELGEYAARYGQQVRLEVHGQCAELTTIQAILDIAQHPDVAICWNSNPQDLEGAGLEANFALVRDRFGRTCHVRPLDSSNYPFQQLIHLLVATNYDGWVMLEASDPPEDRVAALTRQAGLFDEMTARALAAS